MRYAYFVVITKCVMDICLCVCLSLQVVNSLKAKIHGLFILVSVQHGIMASTCIYSILCLIKKMNKLVILKIWKFSKSRTGFTSMCSLVLFIYSNNIYVKYVVLFKIYTSSVHFNSNTWRKCLNSKLKKKKILETDR